MVNTQWLNGLKLQLSSLTYLGGADDCSTQICKKNSKTLTVNFNRKNNVFPRCYPTNEEHKGEPSNDPFKVLGVNLSSKQRSIVVVDDMYLM